MKSYRPAATPFLLREVLGRGMYTDYGRCLAELFRNGLVAGMDGAWKPAGVEIEISVVHNHPLAEKGGSALVVLDHGRGMTDADLDRYFKYLGPSPEASRKDGGLGGASQKGIGRFAALALSQHVDRDECPYYILSRTQEQGQIRYVKVTPEYLCREQGIDADRFIQPSATELGPLRNAISGPFTAVVIPAPVLMSDAEVYEALKWYLPREPDKMCKLLVGHKRVMPPPLPSDGGAISVSSDDGRYRVYIGPSTGKSREHGGVWLADSETGFRVASCLLPALRAKGLPEPIWSPELEGDIFVPGLLARQDTARSALQMDFVRTQEWRKLCLFLSVKVAPRLVDLVDHDPLMKDAAKMLDTIVELFDGVWGPAPEDTPDNPNPNERKPPNPDRIKRTRNGARRKRLKRICVRGEVFELMVGRSLDQDVFADANLHNPRMIELNMRGAYSAFPGNKIAQNEHMLMQILNAIARTSVFPGHDNTFPREVAQLANALRSELLRK